MVDDLTVKLWNERFLRLWEAHCRDPEAALKAELDYYCRKYGMTPLPPLPEQETGG